MGRFKVDPKVIAKRTEPIFYKVYSSSSLWNGVDRDLFDKLSGDGGKKRVINPYKPPKTQWTSYKDFEKAMGKSNLASSPKNEPAPLRTKIQGLLRSPPLRPLRHSLSASEFCIKKAQ